jgi:hypothetical protein
MKRTVELLEPFHPVKPHEEGAPSSCLNLIVHGTACVADRSSRPYAGSSKPFFMLVTWLISILINTKFSFHIIAYYGKRGRIFYILNATPQEDMINNCVSIDFQVSKLLSITENFGRLNFLN